MQKRLLIIGVLMLSHVAAFFAGRMVGVVVGDWGVTHRRFEDERKIIEPVLASDPSFSAVEVGMLSYNGAAYLIGEVGSRSDLDHLRTEMQRLFGESRVDGLVYAVWVVDAPPDRTTDADSGPP